MIQKICGSKLCVKKVIISFQVPVYVIADPPGQKLGVGGSTLYVLSELRKKLPDSMYEKKVLVIHSG